MKRTRQTINELAQEQLPETLNRAIHGIELSVVTQKSGVHVVMNRTRFELKAVLDWGKVLALVLGLMKIWKHG